MFSGAKKLQAMLPELRRRSAERIAENPGFQVLQHDIAEFRRIRDKKTISLNLEERWKEYLAEKKVQDEEAKILQSLAHGAASAPDDAKKDNLDLHLEESLRVMGDMLTLE